MITNPLFYLVAVPALLITGASKGGLGGGLGILAVPLIALTATTSQTTGILLPVLCLMDLFGVWVYRRDWDARNILVLAPAALVGITVGTIGFHTFNEQYIRLLMGTIALSFTLHYWFGGGARREARPPRRILGMFWGAISGFTSFVAHAGAPPLQVYLLPQKLEKVNYVGTMVVYFALVNYVKLIPYAWLGQLNPGNLRTSLVLAPLAPLGIALGVYLNRHINTALFFRICYVLIFGSGIKLILDGTGLLQ